MAMEEGLSPQAVDFIVREIETQYAPQQMRTIIRLNLFGTRAFTFGINEEELRVGGSTLHMLQANTQNLKLRGELHLFRMEQLFPGRIAKCEVIQHLDTLSFSIAVHFKNGHKVVREEENTVSTEFIALCGMVYDLPEYRGDGADA